MDETILPDFLGVEVIFGGADVFVTVVISIVQLVLSSLTASVGNVELSGLVVSIGIVEISSLTVLVDRVELSRFVVVIGRLEVFGLTVSIENVELSMSPAWT